MTDYSKMSIDDLFAWRDQWPAQRTEWNRAELALQKRLAVKHEMLALAADLDGEGLVLVPSNPTPAMVQSLVSWAHCHGYVDRALTRAIAAAPLPASPSSVEG